uniref:Methoprene-tolerant n=1 Tax=Sitodiplosis mosellana TaxID=263140 RepID=A0A2K9P5C3_9DIPT|nr:methoprene-tolerant [Sitodiplosis mosellana]
MYHEMGYPSHSYTNYLGQFESNTYAEPVHYMQNLSAAIPASSVAALPPPPPPPPPYTSDPMHHQHMAMMQSHENRTWYQPPIAVTPQPDHSSNGREARNRAEKNRRDKLNKSIQELAGRVRNVAGSSKRIDKTGILRFSAHGLRIEYVFNSSANSPCQLSINHSSAESLMKLVNGFLIAITCRGNIVVVTPSIEQHLGHCQTDLLGQNILNYTHPEDQAFLKQQLIPKNLEKLFDRQLEDENGEPRARTEEEEKEIDRKLKDDKRYFSIRLARAGPRSEATTYETISFNGSFRRADAAPRSMRSNNYPAGLQMLRRPRCGRDDSIPLPSIGGNDIILIAMGHIVKPPVIYDRLFEASKFEYKTRHLIDGRIVQCDQRISLVAGYMADEVCNLSAFTFMHRDDVRWVMVALRQMYDFNSPYGESCYRLMTRTGSFIYLRTRGYLDIDRDTNQVRSFVCVNALVDEDEGKKLVKEMKKKFTIMIQETEITSNEPDVPAVENPVQLERAIISLITNLHHNDVVGSPETQASIDGHESDTNRSVKSPPLEIIPPKPSSIKTSIVNSMPVVNATLRHFERDSMSDTEDDKTGVKKVTKVVRTTSVVQRNANAKDDTTANTSNRMKTTIGIASSSTSLSSQPNSTTNCIAAAQPNRTSTGSTDISPHSLKDNVTVKQEQPDSFEDSRVPPLPTNAGYFEMSPYDSQQYMEDIASPLECKPFDFLGFDPLQVQQADQSRFLTPETAAQYQCVDSLRYQQYDTGDRASDQSNQPTNVGGIKRSCSSENLSTTNKRRFYDASQNGGDVSEDDEKLPLSIHQTCIEHLTDPGLGLEETLPSSFDVLNASLMEINETASELRDQGTTNQQLNEILEEGKEQSQILDSLRQRYEICLQAVPETIDEPQLCNIDDCDLIRQSR